LPKNHPDASRRKLTYHLLTLGCQMNYSDSERIATVLENLKIKKTTEIKDADLIIFNTCSVRQAAENRVLGQGLNIKKLKEKNPNLKVGLTGCMVRQTSIQPSQDEKKNNHKIKFQIDPLLKKSPWLDFVFRIEDLKQLPLIYSQLFSQKFKFESESASLTSSKISNPKIQNNAAVVRVALAATLQQSLAATLQQSLAATLQQSLAATSQQLSKSPTPPLPNPLLQETRGFFDSQQTNQLASQKTSKPEARSQIANYFSIAPKTQNNFSVFVPIMTGCDNFCTYCIVPYARGREVSRPWQEIVAECKKLIANGAIEITLLGQNVNSYQDKELKNLPPPQPSPFNEEGVIPAFVTLLRKIHDLPGLQRLRFFTSHPKDLSPALIKAFAQLPKLMPHLHLPLQAGDDEILHRMNRNYTAKQYLQLIKKLKKARPDIAISTDMIVGFPGETKKQFENSLRIFEKANFSMAYLSKYSPRIGTISAKFEDNVSHEEKTLRWQTMNEILKKTALAQRKKMLGKITEVLVENYKEGICIGHTPEFSNIRFPGSKKLISKIVKVKVTEAAAWEVRGEIY